MLSSWSPSSFSWYLPDPILFSEEKNWVMLSSWSPSSFSWYLPDPILFSEENHMIHYGLALPNGGVDPRTMAGFAAVAEAAGWDGIFVEDYIIWQGHEEVGTYDPWVLLAAMVMSTKRVRLGTSVTPLARRRPWKVAAEAMTLDHLSAGRVILGVGLGDTGESIGADPSFGRFGEVMEPKQRAQMLDEALEIITGLWRGELFSYEGEYYQVKEVTLLPRPLQTPRIPIWVGGGYPLPGPVNRAARWDGACLYRHKTLYMSPEDVRDLLAIVEREKGSAAGYDIVIGGSPRSEDWEEERAKIRALAEAGMTWWVEYIPPTDPDDMRAAIERGPLRID
jgi:alkanesulfonate monooxygenase SsuD/methylene tetrahydromethanopterin reductase-like flavin-dependent oxidoreductase (luciferase family)